MLHGGDIYGFEGVKDGTLLDFSVNTNPLGMPPQVKEALRRCIDDGAVERYPDPTCRRVRSALARLEGVPAESILCGNGAADLIFRLCLAKKPRQVLLCAPTFSEYENAARLSGGEVVYHRLKEEDGFSLGEDFLADLKTGIDMAFLCNPNNPAGGLINNALLADIIRRCRDRGILLVVDECFLPFTQAPSLAAELGPSLVVLKAFTKTFALAGVRFGYMLSADAALLAAVSAAGQCWGVSVPAQSAALAAVECSASCGASCGASFAQWLEQSRKLIEAEKPFLIHGLRGLGFRVFDSGANFLLFRGDGISLYKPLLEKGILIRTCGSFRGLDDRYYRIGIKGHEQNRTLMSALTEIKKELR
jgi:threonine-phosphate decarboxylase